MESSRLSENNSEPPPCWWANILGSTIAFLTLVFPFYAIANFSSPMQDELLSPSSSYLAQPKYKADY